MESPLVVAQRAAIQEARARYERGSASVEGLRAALDAITEARDTTAVEAALAGLPDTPHRALAAFDPPPALEPAADRRGVARITAFMGATRRSSRPWTLAARSRITAIMGEVRLDLRQARLPHHSVMHVLGVMGDIRILIPEGVRVSVRGRVIMGDVKALGEYIGGIGGNGASEHEPAGSAPLASLEIDATSIMGTVKIVVVNPATTAYVSMAELARDILKDALVGIREGLKQGSSLRAGASARAIESVRAVETNHPGSAE